MSLQSPDGMISVVVPAFNEAAVIHRTLSSMLDGAQRDRLEVVVVCNACTDDTAAIAKGFGPGVQVIETSRASKAHALNLGDRAARAFPRFYVDADIQISGGDLISMAEALEQGPALAVTAGLHMDVSASPWSVRSYQRIWTRLPVIRDGLIGRGVYGVSETGRRHFEEFPDLLADDLFVHRLFAPSGRTSVASCISVVEGPRSLSGLVQRKTRAYVGNWQLDQAEAVGSARHRSATNWLQVVREDPRRVLDVPIYLSVTVMAKARAQWRIRRGDMHTWDRDETTRASVASHARVQGPGSGADVSHASDERQGPGGTDPR